MSDIKKMKLYRHPERVYDDLKAVGYKEDGRLKAEDVAPFDQYHYLGTEAVDDAIEALEIGPKTRIIDIGSGLGGPARYLAEKTGCRVTALELQPDLDRIARSLTVRCGLSGPVTHLCGDILDLPGNISGFDAGVSWLSFLHIPDRAALFKKCNSILNSGGKLFIEDFCKLGEFDREEKKILSEDTYCSYLPTAEEYREQILGNGFARVELIDRTCLWKSFVNERLNRFISVRDHYVQVHGLEVAEDIEDFYKKMLRLFTGGNVGGLRMIAIRNAVT
jgi:cyclopropane fatty-acyl-phospholipid synthase-like methyltransferase